MEDQEGGAGYLHMGELFYSLREGSTAGGPGEGPRAQRV